MEESSEEEKNGKTEEGKPKRKRGRPKKKGKAKPKPKKITIRSWSDRGRDDVVDGLLCFGKNIRWRMKSCFTSLPKFI